MWPLVRQARYLGRYREIAQVLVHHGFGYLVDQLGLTALLPLARRAALRAPAAAPGNAVRLRLALIELGPTFVKLGQALSTRPDMLSADLLSELSKLQDTVPSFPSAQAIATIEAELGRPLTELFAAFEREPFAAASLGQVHAARLHDGSDVVVKVQRPDIAGRIDTDLAILADLAALAQERLATAAQYNPIELVHEFAMTLRAELDYRQEARNAERFAQIFRDDATVHIPRVYWEYSAARVLTSERIRGLKITDLAGLEQAGIDRTALAQASLRITLEEVFTYGFFHSDPHPGNFFVMNGGVIGVVDFGQVGSLDRATTQDLLVLMGALINSDTLQLLRALERLGILQRRAATAALRRDLERFVNTFVGRPLGAISANEVFEGLTQLLRRHHIVIPGALATLFKTLVMIEGLGAQLDPRLDVFATARPYVETALKEQLAPGRLAQQAFGGAVELGELAVEIPAQLSAALQRLLDGQITVQSRETELRRVATALIRAANRIAAALVLSALLIGLAAVAFAVQSGAWQGPLPLLMLGAGMTAVLIGGIFFVFALLRSHE